MKLHIPTPADFSLRETLCAHGWRRLKPFDTADEPISLTRVHRFTGGSVLELTITDGGDQLDVEVSGEVSTAEVEAVVSTMMQLKLPLDAFHAYCNTRPELAHVAVKRQGRVLRSPSVWEDLVKVILTTNTTWSQTKSMTARLVDLWGTPLDPTDPDSPHTFPEPFQIAAIDASEFALQARVGYRASAIHELAQRVSGEELDLEAWVDPAFSESLLWKHLVALKGIGPYAASCMMIYLGRYSRVNVDSWARMMVGKELGAPVTDKEVHAFFAPYGQWQALVYHFYPWREDEPAY